MKKSFEDALAELILQFRGTDPARMMAALEMHLLSLRDGECRDGG